MPMNTFSLDEWERRIPIDGRCIPNYTGNSTSPIGVVATERARRAAAEHGNLGPSVLTDVFCLGIGESHDQTTTKVGGIPARPKNAKWPMTPDGRPFIFVGQFNFRESVDHVQVPADILLVFTAEEPPYTDDKSCILLEWHFCSGDSLMEPVDMPYDVSGRPAFYGVRYRSRDFVDVQNVRRLLDLAFPDNGECMRPRDRDREMAWTRTAQWSGMKIGGMACSTKGEVAELSNGGQLICSLTDVSTFTEVPYPWVNEAAPRTWKELAQRKEVFLWYDGFVLNIFRGRTGDVGWDLLI